MAEDQTEINVITYTFFYHNLLNPGDYLVVIEQQSIDIGQQAAIYRSPGLNVRGTCS